MFNAIQGKSEVSPNFTWFCLVISLCIVEVGREMCRLQPATSLKLIASEGGNESTEYEGLSCLLLSLGDQDNCHNK